LSNLFMIPGKFVIQKRYVRDRISPLWSLQAGRGSWGEAQGSRC
jgi:hypothetical protein